MWEWILSLFFSSLTQELTQELQSYSCVFEVICGLLASVEVAFRYEVLQEQSYEMEEVYLDPKLAEQIVVAAVQVVVVDLVLESQDR